jgi:small-conductance mechanosensitive channel
MPLKNGELNASELRRLIKKHNELMSIKIPKGTNRDGLIKLITDNGYKINHQGQKLEPDVKMKRKPIVKLPPAPAKKTAEEKAEAKKKKKEKSEKQEEDAFESRKKKIEAIKKIRGKKTEGKKLSETEKKLNEERVKLKKMIEKKDDKKEEKVDAPKLVLKKNQSKIAKKNYNSALDFISQYMNRGWDLNESTKDLIRKKFSDKSKKTIVREELKGKKIKLYFVGDDNKLENPITLNLIN